MAQVVRDQDRAVGVAGMGEITVGFRLEGSKVMLSREQSANHASQKNLLGKMQMRCGVKGGVVEAG
jgi:hypothetical protein